jgi:hypothetical protein
MLGDERLELGGEGGVATERELGVVPQLERVQALLLEAARLRPRERLVGKVGEDRAAPERERLPELPGRSIGTAGSELLLGAGDQAHEAVDVQLALVHAQPVALAVRLDPIGTEGRAQPVDVDLERGDCRGRRLLSPELVDQPVARNCLARMEEERRQHGTLLRPPERERAVALTSLDRP